VIRVTSAFHLLNASSLDLSGSCTVVSKDSARSYVNKTTLRISARSSGLALFRACKDFLPHTGILQTASQAESYLSPSASAPLIRSSQGHLTVEKRRYNNSCLSTIVTSRWEAL